MNEELKKRFAHHELTDEQIEFIEELRTRFIELAQFIDANCPISREKALALTHLEISSFYTNASVSRYS